MQRNRESFTLLRRKLHRCKPVDEYEQGALRRMSLDGIEGGPAEAKRRRVVLGTTPVPAQKFNSRRDPAMREKARGSIGTMTVKPRGFTFIELIIVISILSVVSLAIYSTLTNGIKIWQTVNGVLPEEDLQIFLDKFTHEIANTLKFGSIRFLGEPDRLEFACVVYSPRFNNKTVGKIIYGYDPGKNILYKWELDYSQIYNGQEGSPEQALKNIKSLKFQFYFYDGDKKEYLWADEWVREKLPLAVRLELEFKDGSQIDKVTRTLGIPVAS